MADSTTAFGARLDGELVGSSFATNGGSGGEASTSSTTGAKRQPRASPIQSSVSVRAVAVMSFS